MLSWFESIVNCLTYPDVVDKLVGDLYDALFSPASCPNPLQNMPLLHLSCFPMPVPFLQGEMPSLHI